MPEFLRDQRGCIIGRIERFGGEQKIFDAVGHYRGRFDGLNTYDQVGRLVGQGNLLAMLLL